MSIKVGDVLPSGTFMVGGAQGPAPFTSKQLFAGMRVALFAVPGAFTPTCSARHLPGFKEKAAQLFARGIDTIACISVNDVFVMKAWAESQDIGNSIVMLADGNGEFTRALGLELDGSSFGMGMRSRRYSMIANNGVVEQLHVEQGSEFRVSSADYMLAELSRKSPAE